MQRVCCVYHVIFIICLFNHKYHCNLKVALYLFFCDQLIQWTFKNFSLSSLSIGFMILISLHETPRSLILDYVVWNVWRNEDTRFD